MYRETYKIWMPRNVFDLIISVDIVYLSLHNNT